MTRGARPLILTTVGTDHHRFDRLIRWVDGWAGAGGADRADCFAQVGASSPPHLGAWKDYLSHEQMDAAIQAATAVVCHGGPATIMACRRLGALPIVVPRQRRLGEHVDDHQVVFAERLAAAGDIVMARSQGDLKALLDRAVTEPEAFRLPATRAQASGAIQRFGELVDGCVRAPAAVRRRRPAPALAATRLTSASRSWRVLSIAGWGRSGSTLLDRMLGEVPHVVAVGELRDIFERGCVENRLCGCGQPFLRCELWTAVGDEAFGGWRQLDIPALIRTRYLFDRPWGVPLVIGAGPLPARLRHYLDVLTAVYQAIAEVSGAQVIVESSKIPSYALLLARALPARLRVVHLVRDSRGVVFSWQKQVDVPDRPARSSAMLRYGTVAGAVRYNLYNGLAHLFGPLGIPTLLLRYEDLVADPRAQLAAVLAHAGVEADGEALSFLQDGQARLGRHHTVDGNPMRFAHGTVTLRVDEEWRRAMAPGRRLLVAAVTAPLLRRYGYGRRGERARLR